MNTSYVIPAVITAALHAFLLSLNSGKAPAPATATTKPPVTEKTWVTFSEELPPPEPGPAAGGGGREAMGPPTLPETVHARIDLGENIVIAVASHPAVSIFSERVLPDWRPGDLTSNGPGGSGPGNFRGIVDGRFLDNNPTAKVRVAPNYPYALKAEGVDGEVLVDFWVDEKGAVHDPVVRSSTRREFEEPTLAAVAKWRFAPGLKDGKTVRFRMTLPVRFLRADL